MDNDIKELVNRETVQYKSAVSEYLDEQMDVPEPTTVGLLAIADKDFPASGKVESDQKVIYLYSSLVNDID